MTPSDRSERMRTYFSIDPPRPWLARAEARSKARAVAEGAPWLRQVCDHHDRIDEAFAAVCEAADAAGRRCAEARLRTLLAGHALAKELVLYPAMAMSDQKMHATLAYIEQNSTKMHLAALETLDPMGQAYADKLDRVREAVLLQTCQEEGNWFRTLARAGDESWHARLDARYREEFERYVGADAALARETAAEWQDASWWP